MSRGLGWEVAGVLASDGGPADSRAAPAKPGEHVGAYPGAKQPAGAPTPRRTPMDLQAVITLATEKQLAV
ncbi:hypothetical protein AAHZ94_06500 [Streptomyces sp. HSW2009]|uniref:hypothetical protein n=1 Tax=Streptomyces sp. HSW2009 TaxID=3142890 RepID=UPI0032EBBF36